MQVAEQTKVKLENFSNLLKNIKSLDEKKQALWIEIYENAITDRQLAYANYVALLGICADKSNEHAVHGRTIATYLERMSKANDQLLKLADLIASAQEKDEEINADDIYAKLNKHGN
jgi:hypothetical protein